MTKLHDDILMQKIGQKIGYVLCVLLSVIPYLAHAKEEGNDKKPSIIQMDYDIKTQIRVATPAKIKKAINGDTVLDDDGVIYSLTGLDFPVSDATPDTQKRLAELTEGKKCTLYQTRDDKVGRINRMNHTLGHFVCDDVWIQGTLIAEGLARVRTTPENNQQSGAMLLLEQSARDQKLGLWKIPYNAPLTPLTAKDHLDRFVVVEGQVYTTAQTRDAIFLNFTRNWKTDFSIGIPSKLRRDFSKSRIEPLSLRGKTVRVRGWMRNYNGPYIELDHVDQLEIIKAQTSILPPSMGEGQGESEGVKDNKNESQPQFMHTIHNPTPPTIEEPKKPEIKKP